MNSPRVAGWTAVLVVVAVATTLGYRVVKKGWVDFRHGEEHYAAGNYSNALPFYQASWSNGVRDRALFERLVQTSLQTGQASGIVTLASGVLTSASPRNPLSSSREVSDWQARWELARALSYVGRLPEAVAEYRQLLASRTNLFEARLELAHVLFWNGEPDAALVELDLVPADKRDAKARLLAADLYVAGKRFEEAEPLYREWLAAHPDDRDVRLKFADLLSWQKKYDQSLAEFETMLKATPDDVQVRRKYATVLTWVGRHEDAAAQLKKTLP